jgi:hypothetical protein
MRVRLLYLQAAGSLLSTIKEWKITGGKSMEQFEYKTLFTDAKGMLGGKVDQNAFQRELNELGQQGWELVNTVPAAQSYGSTRWIISIFKRKVE